MNMLEELTDDEVLLYRYDDWLSSTDGKLFITGYGGSGKTTLANKLGKLFSVNVINIDIEIARRWSSQSQDLTELIINIVNDALVSPDKVIIEGAQVFLYPQLESLTQKHSVIAKLVPMEQAIIRAIIRDRASSDEIAENLESVNHVRDFNRFVTTMERWS